MFVSAGLSQIWKRIRRENKSKHQLPVLCTYQKQCLDRHHTKRQMGRLNSTLLCLLWIRSVAVNQEPCWKAQREHSTVECIWLLQIHRLPAHSGLFYNLKEEALEAILTFTRKLLSHTCNSCLSQVQWRKCQIRFVIVPILDKRQSVRWSD